MFNSSATLDPAALSQQPELPDALLELALGHQQPPPPPLQYGNRFAHTGQPSFPLPTSYLRNPGISMDGQSAPPSTQLAQVPMDYQLTQFSTQIPGGTQSQADSGYCSNLCTRCNQNPRSGDKLQCDQCFAEESDEMYCQ